MDQSDDENWDCAAVVSELVAPLHWSVLREHNTVGNVGECHRGDGDEQRQRTSRARQHGVRNRPWVCFAERVDGTRRSLKDAKENRQSMLRSRCLRLISRRGSGFRRTRRLREFCRRNMPNLLRSLTGDQPARNMSSPRDSSSRGTTPSRGRAAAAAAASSSSSSASGGRRGNSSSDPIGPSSVPATPETGRPQVDSGAFGEEFTSRSWMHSVRNCVVQHPDSCVPHLSCSLFSLWNVCPLRDRSAQLGRQPTRCECRRRFVLLVLVFLLFLLVVFGRCIRRAHFACRCGRQRRRRTRRSSRRRLPGVVVGCHSGAPLVRSIDFLAGCFSHLAVTVFLSLHFVAPGECVHRVWFGLNKSNCMTSFPDIISHLK